MHNVLDGCVSAVIVNWNSGNQLRDALTSLAKHHAGLVRLVVVVDNGSTDGSASQLHAPAEMECVVIRNERNAGFAAACNQGARLVQTPYILFLNPDTLLYSSTLPNAVGFMESDGNSKVGICGVRLVGDDGAPTTCAARFPTCRVLAGSVLGLSRWFPRAFPSHLLTHADLQRSQAVDQVIGAFFLIRRSVFAECDGFDERFFVYFEEVDLSLRAKALGYASHYVAEATAYHRGGGCSDQVKATRLFYSLRSRLQFAHKHYRAHEVAYVCALTFLELPLRLVRAATRFSREDARNTLAAYVQLAHHLGASWRWR